MLKALLLIFSVIQCRSAFATTIQSCSFMRGSQMYTTFSSELSMAQTKKTAGIACLKKGAPCVFSDCTQHVAPANKKIRPLTATYAGPLIYPTNKHRENGAVRGSQAGDCNYARSTHIYTQSDCDAMQDAADGLQGIRQDSIERERNDAIEDNTRAIENATRERQTNREIRDIRRQVGSARRLPGSNSLGSRIGRR